MAIQTENGEAWMTKKNKFIVSYFFFAVRDYFWHAKMDVLYVHIALTGVRNNSEIFYGL